MCITHTYSAPLFISPTILLLPNNARNALELFDITSASTRPFVTLCLPDLQDNSRPSIKIQCEPNSFTVGPLESESPFHPASIDAIICFNITITTTTGRNRPIDRNFFMFVHRKTLLKLTNLDKDEQDGVIPWQTWGPNATRWMNDLPRSLDIDVAGPRAVGKILNMIAVLDFHPPRVRTAKAKLLREQAGDGPTWVQDDETSIVCSVFKETVLSRLPYVARVPLDIEIHTSSRWFIDEEHLIEFKVRIL